MSDKTFNVLTQLSLNDADFKSGLNKVKSNVKDLITGVKGATGNINEMQRALGALKNVSFAGKSIDEINAIKARMRELTNDIRNFNNEGKKTGGAFSNIGGALKSALPVASVAAGIAAIVGGLKSLASNVINTRKEFSTYEAVLTNTLGSQEAANDAFSKLQEFASQTPFQLNELTSSYVKLVNQGFKPSMGEMKKLGDLAAAMGKSFNQLTEAIIDAQVGENERLKEFGIRAKKEGDIIKYTFKGVTTEVDNNAASIRNYILSLGDLQGVQGGMEKISKTLGGALSNAGDAADNFFNVIGKKLEPGLVSLIGTYTTLLNTTSKLINSDISAVDRANEKLKIYREQTQEYDEQESKINDLISTYNQLSPKTIRTDEENIKLKDTITQLGNIFPTAITEWGQYGEALDINVLKINSAREAQRLLNIEMQKDVADTFIKSIEKQQNKISLLNNDIEARNKLLNDSTLQSEVSKYNPNKNLDKILDDTRITIQKNKQELEKYDLEIGKALLSLQGLGFTNEELALKIGSSTTEIEAFINKYVEVKKLTGSGTKKDGGVSTEILGAYDLLNKQIVDLEKNIKNVLATGGIVSPDMLNKLGVLKNQLTDINNKIKEAGGIKITNPEIEVPEIDTSGMKLVELSDPVKLDFQYFGIQKLENDLNKLQEAQRLASNPEVWQDYQSKIESVQGSIAEFKGETDALGKAMEMASAVGNTLANGLSNIGSSIVESFGLAKDGFEGFLGTMLKGVVEILSMLLANAVANAIVSGTESAKYTGPAAVFTLPAFVATAVGTVLAAFATIPKFATGGIVPGSSYTGDSVPVMVNSGEMILNKSQQSNLFNMLNNGGSSGREVVFRVEGTQLVGVLNNHSRKIKSIK